MRAERRAPNVGMIQASEDRNSVMNNRRFSIVPLTAGILTLVGMCLPWAHIGRSSISGWNGAAFFVGVPCPGYLVAIVASVAIVSLCAQPVGKFKWVLPLSMCGYGIFHSGFMALALTATSGMTIGIGIPITMTSFGLIVFCSFQPNRRATICTEGWPQRPPRVARLDAKRWHVSRR